MDRNYRNILLFLIILFVSGIQAYCSPSTPPVIISSENLQSTSTMVNMKKSPKDIIREIDTSTQTEYTRSLVKQLPQSKPETAEDIDALVKILRRGNLNFDLFSKIPESQYGDNEKLLYAAFQSLINVNKQNKELVKIYIPLLDDENVGIKQAAIEVMRGAKPKEAIRHLLGIMKHPGFTRASRWHARSAAQVLAAIRDDSVLPEMVDQIGSVPDVEFEVRKFGSKSVPLLLKKIRETNDHKLILKLVQAFPIDGESYKDLMPILGKLYKDESLPLAVRGTIFDAIYDHNPQLLKELSKGFWSEPWWVKDAILGDIADQSSWDDLSLARKIFQMKDDELKNTIEEPSEADANLRNVWERGDKRDQIVAHIIYEAARVIAHHGTLQDVPLLMQLKDNERASDEVVKGLERLTGKKWLTPDAKRAYHSMGQPYPPEYEDSKK